MVSSSSMHNFPSPLRVNHAGEVVQDVLDEEILRKVSSPPERKAMLTSGSDAKKTKGKKEAWFRTVRKRNAKDKQGENALNFQGIENILENVQYFTCGPLGDNTDDEKKKKKYLPTLTVSKTEGMKADDGTSKKDMIKKKDKIATSKDNGVAKPEQKTKWFKKKKHQQEEPAQYDIWAVIMPSFGETENDMKREKRTKLQWFRLSSKGKEEKKVASEEGRQETQETKEPLMEESRGCEFVDISATIAVLISQESVQAEDKTTTKDGANKDGVDGTDPEASGDKRKGKKIEKKATLQLFRRSSKGKEEKKETSVEEKGGIQESPGEDSKGINFNEFYAMIIALVNRETEEAEAKSPSIQYGTKTETTDGTNALKEIDLNTESSIALWYDRLKSGGEGYIRFVSGSDPTEANPPTSITNTGTTPKQEDDPTFLSDGSESATTFLTEFSSYEVPSLFQEMSQLSGFGRLSKKARRQSKSLPQEDEKYLLRKIVNDPSPRRSAQICKDNTLTLQAMGQDDANDHGFKVKLHQDRAVCEV